jgi:hypothetical protein
MRIWLDSVSSERERTRWAQEFVDRFRSLAAENAAASHSVAGSPAEADVVLLVDCQYVPHDPGLRALRRNPLFRRFREKTLIYDERDVPWPAWPGVFMSMPRNELVPAFQKPWLYAMAPFPRIEPQAPPDLLFSFVGSPSHPVRRAVADLHHERAQVETVAGFTFYDPEGLEFVERRRRYDELIARSKFVLCPRGKGASSIRLLEVLAAGRVPVIISDDWMPPEGPDWQTFSILCPEKDVGAIPALLEEREADFEELAAAARRIYSEWFSRERTFARIGDLCAALLESDAPARFPARGVRGRAYFRAHADHLRWCTRARLVRAVRRLQRGV